MSGLQRGSMPRQDSRMPAVAASLWQLLFRARRMLTNYLPILIFLVIATGLAVVLLTLGTGIGRFFSRNPRDPDKLSPYECGFDAFEDSRMKFDVRYYLVAILVVGFIYEWKKGALEWD